MREVSKIIIYNTLKTLEEAGKHGNIRQFKYNLENSGILMEFSKEEYGEIFLLEFRRFQNEF